MRQIVLDTETTGLSPQSGHRIIEIGAVEIINRRLTGQKFHFYLNPDRDIDFGAQKVHGITRAFLKDKPRFKDIYNDFLKFIQSAEIIIHNAPFDVGFINHELALIDKTLGIMEDYAQILDSLVIARKKHPNQKNSLDALSKRYEVDCFERELHGALLDANILAQVYLAMTGGQAHLSLEMETVAHSVKAKNTMAAQVAQQKVIHASAEELSLHQAYLQKIKEASGGECIWLQD